MSIVVSDFIQQIEENIYKISSIYRSILIGKNLKECMLLKKHLEKKDYSTVVIDYIDNNIYYNNLDERIVIICSDMFVSFIEKLDKYEGGIMNSTYNFIGFSNMLGDNVVRELVNFYVEKTQNNTNNTIILDKNYANLIKFKQCCI